MLACGAAGADDHAALPDTLWQLEHAADGIVLAEWQYILLHLQQCSNATVNISMQSDLSRLQDAVRTATLASAFALGNEALNATAAARHSPSPSPSPNQTPLAHCVGWAAWVVHPQQLLGLQACRRQGTAQQVS